MGSIPVRVTKKYCRKVSFSAVFFIQVADLAYHRRRRIPLRLDDIQCLRIDDIPQRVADHIHAFGVIGMREYENLFNYLSKYDIIRKSSSSVYANIREANYGQSKADMLSKFEIGLKECSETEGWLQLLFNTNAINKETYKKYHNLCGRIRRMLISSCKTLKEHK